MSKELTEKERVKMIQEASRACRERMIASGEYELIKIKTQGKKLLEVGIRDKEKKAMEKKGTCWVNVLTTETVRLLRAPKDWDLITGTQIFITKEDLA